MKATLFCVLAAVAACAFAADEDAKNLPDGPGKDIVAKVCIDCHSAASFRKQRLSEADWWDKVGDMVDRGAKADEKQQEAIVAYLVKNFGPGAKVNMNTAPSSELIVVLGFSIDESKAILAYRTEHGAFHDAADVAKIPGVDVQKVESQKQKMTF